MRVGREHTLNSICHVARDNSEVCQRLSTGEQPCKVLRPHVCIIHLQHTQRRGTAIQKATKAPSCRVVAMRRLGGIKEFVIRIPLLKGTFKTKPWRAGRWMKGPRWRGRR